MRWWEEEEEEESEEVRWYTRGGERVKVSRSDVSAQLETTRSPPTSARRRRETELRQQPLTHCSCSELLLVGERECERFRVSGRKERDEGVRSNLK